jgi:hypothetical protein
MASNQFSTTSWWNVNILKGEWACMCGGMCVCGACVLVGLCELELVLDQLGVGWKQKSMSARI